MSKSAPVSSVFWPVQPTWQLDPRHPIPAEERRTSCAVATVKMLLDHFLPDQSAENPFHRVREEMIRAGGKDHHGHWRHVAQIRVLSSLGLVAWRRNWSAPSQDPQWLADHEGYSPEQLSAVRAQTAAEAALEPEARPWHSLRTTLFASGPVIASVKPGFTTNRQNHQVVLHGYRHEGQTEIVAFVDPLENPHAEHVRREMELPRFLSFFNRRAVFAQAGGVAGAGG
jgi:hypothetical protein